MNTSTKLKSNLPTEVSFADGREVSIPLEWFSSLREASEAELNNWRLIGGGEGIHWEDLDEDLLVGELIS
jgi:hypothetical protein